MATAVTVCNLGVVAAAVYRLTHKDDLDSDQPSESTVIATIGGTNRSKRSRGKHRFGFRSGGSNSSTIVRNTDRPMTPARIFVSTDTTVRHDTIDPDSKYPVAGGQWSTPSLVESSTTGPNDEEKKRYYHQQQTMTRESFEMDDMQSSRSYHDPRAV